MSDQNGSQLLDRLTELLMRPEPGIAIHELLAGKAEMLELLRDADDVTLLRAAKLADVRTKELGEEDYDPYPFSREEANKSLFSQLIPITRFDREQRQAVLDPLIEQIKANAQEIEYLASRRKDESR